MKKEQNVTPATENHPWEPFAPANAKILFLGSFPPPRTRWSMEFYYPNITNDFWRIIGIIFFGEKEHFIEQETRRFKEKEIKNFLTKKGIALYDAATAVRRLKNNASDKFLEIVTPTDIASLLEKLPECNAIVTTGQKATEIITATIGCRVPSIGTSTIVKTGKRTINIWRLPSTSRAYPLAVEKKAEYYYRMFTAEGII